MYTTKQWNNKGGLGTVPFQREDSGEHIKQSTGLPLAGRHPPTTQRARRPSTCGGREMLHLHTHYSCLHLMTWVFKRLCSSFSGISIPLMGCFSCELSFFHLYAYKIKTWGFLFVFSLYINLLLTSPSASLMKGHNKRLCRSWTGIMGAVAVASLLHYIMELYIEGWRKKEDSS